MRANIRLNEKIAYITGKTELEGKDVEATDLRAGACLVVAGLIADGKTIINNAEHILRGYSNIVEKLKNVGADIEIE
jgi:UDP-N-acetylglucosamine 1-carboxyvinyltransferase